MTADKDAVVLLCQHGYRRVVCIRAKELKFNAVFRMANGKLQPVIKDLSRPNGVAISPDQKTLYVANSEEKNRIWMAYDIADDGTVSNARLFANVTPEKDAG